MPGRTAPTAPMARASSPARFGKPDRPRWRSLSSPAPSSHLAHPPARGTYTPEKLYVFHLLDLLSKALSRGNVMTDLPWRVFMGFTCLTL